MAGDYKKNDRRDRRDRIFLKNIDSMHVIMPYVMPTRCANEALMSYEFDITEVDRYVKEKNAQNPEFKYTWFHIICAALAKTIILRPKLNYFISGYRMFERRDIEIAFTCKRQFNDSSEEALARFIVDKNGGSLIEQVHSFVQKFVTKVRKEHKTEGITNKFNFYQVLPRPLFKMFVAILRRMEYHGIYPDSLKKDDPCYSTLYITNLGSIKMSADYHHVFEWGTNSFFVVMSEMKKIPFFKEDGSYELKPTIKLSFTIDERIADGFYFAKSVKLLKQLLEKPELLDLDANSAVDIDFFKNNE